MWQQFTAAFKRKVIEFAEANGNMSAQWQFGVSEKKRVIFAKPENQAFNVQRKEDVIPRSPCGLLGT